MKSKAMIFSVMMVIVGAASLLGQSTMINYQGRITADDGVPLNGTYSMQFSIYSQSTGGSALWSETQSSIMVENGIFNILLGSITSIPSSLFNGDERWLGVKIGSDPEMSPRQQIVSVGYALRADKANDADDSDRLDGQHASSFAAVNHNHDDTYPTEDDLNTSDGDGPNSGSNQVHWDNLWGVPAGFADGIDDEGSGGVGDGHSLDAADGSPTDVVYVDDDGDVGVGTTTPDEALTVEGTIKGTFIGTDGYAIYGDATDTGSGTNYGGYFLAKSVHGRAVFGKATNTGDVQNFGGYFEAAGNDGQAVHGSATNTASDINYGGYFTAYGLQGRGVYGLGMAASGENYGVYGKTNSSTGFGGYFDGRGYFSGNVGIGTTNPQGRLDISGGPLAVGGDPGSSGQVLTSQGSGSAPIWSDVSTDTDFGARENKSCGSVYQATNAGFVVCTILKSDPAGTGSVAGYADNSNPPTANRAQISFHHHSGDPTTVDTFTMPVRKNEYWKVEATPTVTCNVYWIPLQ